MEVASAPPDRLRDAEPSHQVDLIVIGSGAGGLAAAVTAANMGMRVAVFEKDAVLGGTTAWSGGVMWVPGSGLSEESVPSDARSAMRYLERTIPQAVFAAQHDKLDAYLRYAPKMVKYFNGELGDASLVFEEVPDVPDFDANAHARLNGRAIRVRRFDGRRLRQFIRHLRAPLPELTLAGMGIEAGRELGHFLGISRSLHSLLYVTWRLAMHVLDLLVHGRGMTLVNGNALSASLVHAAIQIEHAVGGQNPVSSSIQGFRRIGLFPSHPVARLIEVDGKVTRAVVEAPEGTYTVQAKRGIVLACGGFPHDIARKRRLMPHAPNGFDDKSAAVPACTGDGLRMGESVGGTVGPCPGAPAVWAPTSLMPRKDGSLAVFPHLVERGKPGVMAVRRDGLRFCNEALSYHDFVDQWLSRSPATGPVEAWLVCDRCFLFRYGLGAVQPGGLNAWYAKRSGYLKMGRSLASLASQCGISIRGLQASVKEHNDFLAKGKGDPLFHRGETAFDRSQGDPAVRPNPCLAPIVHAPYFAVRLHPGCLGTFAGLATDCSARVLDAEGDVVEGLYACGNDMASAFGGFYPSSGMTLGSAMTFGFIAASHAVKQGDAQ